MHNGLNSFIQNILNGLTGPIPGAVSSGARSSLVSAGGTGAERQMSFSALLRAVSTNSSFQNGIVDVSTTPGVLDALEKEPFRSFSDMWDNEIVAGFNLSERVLGAGMEKAVCPTMSAGSRHNAYELLCGSPGGLENGWTSTGMSGESARDTLLFEKSYGVGVGGIGFSGIPISDVGAAIEAETTSEKKPAAATEHVTVAVGRGIGETAPLNRGEAAAAAADNPAVVSEGGKVPEPDTMAGNDKPLEPRTIVNRTGTQRMAESASEPAKSIEKTAPDMMDGQRTSSHVPAEGAMGDVRGPAASLFAAFNGAATPAGSGKERTDEPTAVNNRSRHFAALDTINADMVHQPASPDRQSSLNQFLNGHLSHGKAWSAKSYEGEAAEVRVTMTKPTADGMDRAALPDDGQVLFAESGEKATEEPAPVKDSAGTARTFQSEIVNQVVRNAAANLKNGRSEFRINLKPEHLGNLHLRVMTEHNQVTVKIIAESTLVKEALENNFDVLKASLESQGLKVDNLEVSISHDRPKHHEHKDTASALAELLEKREDDTVAMPKDKPEISWMAGGHDRSGSNRISCFA